MCLKLIFYYPYRLVLTVGVKLRLRRVDNLSIGDIIEIQSLNKKGYKNMPGDSHNRRPNGYTGMRRTNALVMGTRLCSDVRNRRTR